MVPVQIHQFPSQQSLAFFSSSCGDPASFFTGVVAGTTGCRTRRWQTGGGREKEAQVDNFESQVLSSGSSGAFETVPEVCRGARLSLVVRTPSDALDLVRQRLALRSPSFALKRML